MLRRHLVMWQLIADKTFEPSDLSEVVGSFSLEPEDDTIWVRLTELSPSPPRPWAYGILSWKTADGYELGSVKAYGQTESEVFRLGVGLSPLNRYGVITFTPRAFNLGWIKNGFPWPLRFEAQSGTAAIGGNPALGTRATLMVPAIPRGNAQPDFTIENEFAHLILRFLMRK